MGTKRAHCYAASFGHDLARELLEANMSRPGLVVDPFSGSGTTLVEASAAGHQFLGIDVDPIACLISRTQTRKYSGEWLQDCLKEFLLVLEEIELGITQTPLAARAKRAGGIFAIGRLKASIPAREEIDYWFTAHQRIVLATLAAVAGSFSSERKCDIFRLAISSAIIRKWPNTLSCAMDIDHPRPHRRRPLSRTIPEIFALFRRVLREIVSVLSSRNLVGRGSVVRGDSASALMLLEQQTADLVLTSPPYVSAINYPRAHKFSEWWLYPSDEECKPENYIGLRSGFKDLDRLADVTAKRAPLAFSRVEWLKSHSKKKFGLLCRYVSDMANVIAGCFRVLKPGGTLVFVLADNAVDGKSIPVTDVVGELLETCGFAEVRHVCRPIVAHRRRYPFGFNGVMSQDFLITARRPLVIQS